MERIDCKKEFLKVFNSLCYSRSAWQVWSDFITASACSIANAVDKGKHFEEREKEYTQCIECLGGEEKAAQLFSFIVMALEENPNQDFLGSLYMELNLGSHWKGQFFTPYCLCELLSKMTIGETAEAIKKKGWTVVNDPSCGAGATLIAAANIIKEKGINYQRNVLFVAQDIDRITGLMCYIQLSLLGCAGYVVIADTLSNPIVGKSALFIEEKEGQEVWYMPMFCSEVWESRRTWNYIDAVANCQI